MHFSNHHLWFSTGVSPNIIICGWTTIAHLVLLNHGHDERMHHRKSQSCQALKFLEFQCPPIIQTPGPHGLFAVPRTPRPPWWLHCRHRSAPCWSCAKASEALAMTRFTGPSRRIQRNLDFRRPNPMTDPAGAGIYMLTWLGLILMGSMAHHSSTMDPSWDMVNPGDFSPKKCWNSDASTKPLSFRLAPQQTFQPRSHPWQLRVRDRIGSTGEHSKKKRIFLYPLVI